MLAPGLVVYTAFEQWLQSKLFLKELNDFVRGSSAGKVNVIIWLKTQCLKTADDETGLDH